MQAVFMFAMYNDQIAGYGYECVLEYANGTTTTLQSVYIAHSEHPLNCQPAVNQVSPVGRPGLSRELMIAAKCVKMHGPP